MIRGPVLLVGIVLPVIVLETRIDARCDAAMERRVAEHAVNEQALHLHDVGEPARGRSGQPDEVDIVQVAGHDAHEGVAVRVLVRPRRRLHPRDGRQVRGLALTIDEVVEGNLASVPAQDLVLLVDLALRPRPQLQEALVDVERQVIQEVSGGDLLVQLLAVEQSLESVDRPHLDRDHAVRQRILVLETKASPRTHGIGNTKVLAEHQATHRPELGGQICAGINTELIEELRDVDERCGTRVGPGCSPYPALARACRGSTSRWSA